MSKSIINLTRGVPPVEVFPLDDLIQCGEVCLREDPDVLLQYGRSPGYLPLREWLAAQHDVGADQILVANSSLEIFAFATQTLLRPGDRAFVESPSYDRAITLLRRAGADVVGIPLESDGMDMTILKWELEKGTPVLVYVIADFNNPSGITRACRNGRGWLNWPGNMDSGLPRMHPTGHCATRVKTYQLFSRWLPTACCTCHPSPS